MGVANFLSKSSSIAIPPPLSARPRGALAHLARVDAGMARAIELGVRFRLPPREPTLHMLCRSVIGQSISLIAAQRIVERFSHRFGEEDVLLPAHLLTASLDDVRGLGLTMGKAAAIRSLAEVWGAQRWTSQSVRLVPDDELMRRLTAIKGIGPWTVKMFQIFGLRRPDVLPFEDLGLREGVRLIDHAEDRPSPKDTVTRTEIWSPWRTVGTVIAWQAVMHARGGDLGAESGWW